MEAASEDEIAEAAAWARERGVALFVLGGGSNLLVVRCGIRWAGAARGREGYRAGRASCSALARARTGTHCVRADCVEAGFAGVECLAGIPGTVGGTPVQNVGAYGQEVASAIERVRAFDLTAHAFVEFTAEECGFAYRRSRFNSADRGRYVVTRVDYRLRRAARRRCRMRI